MRLIDWINVATMIIVLNKKLIAFINIILVHIAHENTWTLVETYFVYILHNMCAMLYNYRADKIRTMK